MPACSLKSLQARPFLPRRAGLAYIKQPPVTHASQETWHGMAFRRTLPRAGARRRRRRRRRKKAPSAGLSHVLLAARAPSLRRRADDDLPERLKLWREPAALPAPCCYCGALPSGEWTRQPRLPAIRQA
eukprot:scaffold3324_cov371-Prasinococcus_capsulatus_cf.AAC.3